MMQHRRTNLVGACLLLLFLSFVPDAAALSAGEVTALVQILSNYPALSQVALYDRYPVAGSPTLDYGPSWGTIDVSLCDGGEGWPIYGVHCSASHHIDTLRFDDAWGFPVGTIFDDVPGLIYLISYQSAIDEAFSDDFQLATAIASSSSVPLEIFSTLTAFPPEICEKTSLKSLSIQDLSAACSFVGLNSLETLKYRGEANLADLSIIPTLRTLTLQSFNSSLINEGYFEEFPALVSLSIEFRGDEPNVVLTVPDTLKSVSLNQNGGLVRSIIVGLESSNSQLESVSVQISSTFNLTLPDNVKHLSLAQSNLYFLLPHFPRSLESFSTERLVTNYEFPLDLDLCVNLTTLNLVGSPLSVERQADIPQLNNAKLETVSISRIDISQETIEKLICGSIQTLRSLTFGVATSGGYSVMIPSCITSSTTLEAFTCNARLLGDPLPALPSSLTSLTLVYVPNFLNALDWSDLVTRFPHLQLLMMPWASGAPIEGEFPGEALKSLTSLQVLQLDNLGLNGTIPLDFFEVLSNLKYIRLLNNPLTGTVPLIRGMANLDSISFINNLFTHWPDPEVEAPMLRYLEIDEQPALLTIPSDEAISKNFKKLELFSISNSPLLGSTRPLPAFWASHAMIHTVDMRQCSFQGTMPPQFGYAPQLRQIDLSSNRLCGSLPSVPSDGEIGLQVMLLNDNGLTGSIPPSWSSKMEVKGLGLNSNFLSGVIPNPPLATGSLRRMTFIDISNNSFSGPMFNLSNLNPGNLLSINSLPLMDFCASNPHRENSGICSALGSDICGCRSYYTNCYTTCDEPGAPMAPPQENFGNQTCFAPIYPSLPINCPLPVPSPQFHCHNGQWIASTGITTPKLTLPPNLGNIVVEGSVSSETLVFDGLGTTLTVEGCVYLSDGIIIQLNSTTEVKDPIILLEQKGGSNCSSSLQDLKITIYEPKSCKKTKIQKDSTLSNNNRLAVLFEIDSSSCNVKWIILGSVLGSVVIIVVIGIILAYNFSPSFRKVISPFSARNA